MKESQRAPQAQSNMTLSGVASLYPSDPSGTPTEDEVWKNWRLQRDKILFFFALAALVVLGAAGVAILRGEYPLELKTGVGVFLAGVGASFLRHLIGEWPPWAMLAGELIKAWSLRFRSGPPS